MPRERREQLILRRRRQVFAVTATSPPRWIEIAELAGVSKPMLYAYFGSKEGLYVAYIERTGASCSGDSSRRSLRGTSPTARSAGADHRVPRLRRGARDGWTGAVPRGRPARPFDRAWSRSCASRSSSRSPRMLEPGSASWPGLEAPASDGDRARDRRRRRVAGQLVARASEPSRAARSPTGSWGSRQAALASAAAPPTGAAPSQSLSRCSSPTTGESVSSADLADREQHAGHERLAVDRVVADRQRLPDVPEDHLLVGDEPGEPDRVDRRGSRPLGAAAAISAAVRAAVPLGASSLPSW